MVFRTSKQASRASVQQVKYSHFLPLIVSIMHEFVEKKIIQAWRQNPLNHLCKQIKCISPDTFSPPTATMLSLENGWTHEERGNFYAKPSEPSELRSFPKANFFLPFIQILRSSFLSVLTPTGNVMRPTWAPFRFDTFLHFEAVCALISHPQFFPWIRIRKA